jgi:hypothetical protein
LIHWQRLPPPIQGGKQAPFGATGERTYDGSFSMLDAEVRETRLFAPF